jgi:hypothetical protein
MIATSRRYRIELMNYLYAIRNDRLDATVRESFRAAREAYIASVAETHLTAPDAVLTPLETVTRGLSRAFQLIMRLQDGEPDPDWPVERLEAYLVGLWDEWAVLRRAMRADLGVPD